MVFRFHYLQWNPGDMVVIVHSPTCFTRHPARRMDWCGNVTCGVISLVVITGTCYLQWKQYQSSCYECTVKPRINYALEENGLRDGQKLCVKQASCRNRVRTMLWVGPQEIWYNLQQVCETILTNICFRLYYWNGTWNVNLDLLLPPRRNPTKVWLRNVEINLKLEWKEEEEDEE